MSGSTENVLRELMKDAVVPSLPEPNWNEGKGELPIRIVKPGRAGQIEQVAEALSHFVQVKNQRYGDSALTPVRVFSKAEAGASIRVRLDDKLSRIKNSDELRKNDVADLLGYLILLCIDQGWSSFNDLLD